MHTNEVLAMVPYASLLGARRVRICLAFLSSKPVFQTRDQFHLLSNVIC